MEHLTTFVGECDRKTEAAKKRLAETQEELSAEVAAKAQKVLTVFFWLSNGDVTFSLVVLLFRSTYWLNRSVKSWPKPKSLAQKDSSMSR